MQIQHTVKQFAVPLQQAEMVVCFDLLCELMTDCVSQEASACGIRSFQSSSAAQQQPISAPDLIEVFVNDQPINIPKGSTVMAACDAAGVDIPRYTSSL